MMYSKDQRVEIGRRLQQIRGARDQRTFAEAVGSVQQTISKYERGEIPRSWLFLARLAEQENIDLSWLLIGYGGPGEGESQESDAGSGTAEGNGREQAGRSGEEDEGERPFAERERMVTRF